MSIPPPPPSWGQQLRDWWHKRGATQQMQGQHGQMGAQRAVHTPPPSTPFPNPLTLPAPVLTNTAVGLGVAAVVVVATGGVGLPVAVAIVAGTGLLSGAVTYFGRQGGPNAATALCTCGAAACLASAVALPNGIGGPGMNDHLDELGAVEIRDAGPDLSTKAGVEQAAAEWLDTDPNSAVRVGRGQGDTPALSAQVDLFARDENGNLLYDENGNLILRDLDLPAELDPARTDLSDFTLDPRFGGGFAPPNLQENLPEWGEGNFFQDFTGTPAELAALAEQLASWEPLPEEELRMEVDPELADNQTGIDWGNLGSADTTGDGPPLSGSWGHNPFLPDGNQGWQTPGLTITQHLLGAKGVSCSVTQGEVACVPPAQVAAAVHQLCTGGRSYVLQCPVLGSVGSTPAQPVLAAQAAQAGAVADPVSILVSGTGGALYLPKREPDGSCQPVKYGDDPIIKVHTSVQLTQAAQDWIRGELQQRFPGAAVRQGSYCSISGFGAAPPVANGMRLQQHPAVSWQPPDPGTHDVTVTLISGYGAVVRGVPFPVHVELLLAGAE